MDGLPQFSTNSTSTSAAQHSSSSAISQLQQQTSAAPSAQTLPPPQTKHHYQTMQHPAYDYQQNQRSSGTPNPPGSSAPGNNNTTMTSYPPPPAQNGTRGGGYGQGMSNPYQQQYPTTSSVATTSAPSHPQPIAPAPSPGLQATGRAPPVLRPMPAPGVMPQAGMNSPYGQSPLMAQQSMLQEGEAPTHVVGSQGRRGILPSAPGRPAAPAAGTAGKTAIPPKDADGKFPCPHCTKTYLHAKHLKRHLLRHTGDRPYMCVLCRDTFSRSDILKRHFIKCSIRRGNPTGATHLSHPQAHVKKNPASQQKGMGDGDVNHLNGMGNMPTDQMAHPFGLIPASDGLSNIANEAQLSRSSSLQRLDDGANRDRRNITGSVMGAPAHQSYNGNDVSNNMGSNINPQLGSYNMPQPQNGMMFGGSTSAGDWSQMFSPGAQPTYVHAFPPNVGQTQQIAANKTEPSSTADDAQSVGIPASTPSDPSLFPSWGVSTNYPDSYQQLSAKIINFLHSSGSHGPAIRHVFQPALIRELLENYTHFHTHFSILHIPTFQATDAYVGLLASMATIGACYTGRVQPVHVREVMGHLDAAIQKSSRVFVSLLSDHSESYSLGGNKQLMEELQSIMLTQVLLTWHGTPTQRDKARRLFPYIASFARKTGLLRVSTNVSLYSHIHQPDFSHQTFSASTFNWKIWLEQEKLVRMMYFIFLSDVALGLYFNSPPQFDAFDLQLPLPADDAAWEANNVRECAESLGLYGPALAKRRNPDGTRRCNQPEIHLVLKALLNASYQIQPGATNLYGKFILIHAIIAMMKRAQLEGGVALINPSDVPLPPNAWFVGSSGGATPNASGRATPVQADAGLLDRQTVKTFATALDKFKSNWDHDMAAQFPPSAAAHPRRYGFCRDGVHFYWLANYLLNNTRSIDLQMPPDQRFLQIIHVLKSVKNWVLSDAASRGEELGSVGEIDATYGVADLTLDMTQLFRPLTGVGRSSAMVATAAV